VVSKQQQWKGIVSIFVSNGKPVVPFTRMTSPSGQRKPPRALRPLRRFAPVA
jgi:hypothetical protein